MHRWLLFICCFWFSWLTGQSVVFFQNPSFEDTPRRSKTPYGWYLCGANHHSPPDIHPENIFKVTKSPADGITYLGMVSRADGSVESIEQVLSEPLQPGTYRMDFFAARSDEYYSYSVPVDQWVHFDHPLHLAVYGSDVPCSTARLLGRSQLVKDTAWQYYTLTLKVSAPVGRLQIRVEPPGTADSIWHGSMLIDGLSPIVPVDSQSGTLLAVPDSGATLPAKGDVAEIKALLNSLPGDERALNTVLLQHPGGQLMQVNGVLLAVARWAARRESQRLVLALHPRVSDRLVFAIHRAMRAAEVPEGGYRLKRKRGRGKHWIGESFLKIKLK
jgi:hypothetical protein